MSFLLRTLSTRLSTCGGRRSLSSARPVSFRHGSSSSLVKSLVWGSAAVAAAAFALRSTVHLDADVPMPLGTEESAETIVDPASSIAFPTSLKISSRSPLPTFTLIGVGVRTVSFLGVKVYSVGFYADLANPNLSIPKFASADEKIEHIIRNSACVLRIIPTRSTSFSHLRDGFIRTLQARMQLLKKRGEVTPAEEAAAQSPLRQFKSCFPNTAFPKHAILDLLLTPPVKSKPRTLILRDLGVVQDDWVANHFVLGYFEGDGLSPPLKKMVVERLADFGY